VTNPAAGHPPAPHPPQSRPHPGDPQQPALPNPATQPPPAPYPQTPRPTVQQAQNEATRQLPNAQHGSPQAQFRPHPTEQQADGILQGPLPAAQQGWPQGSGYPPGAPGPYSPSPGRPRNRKPGRIITGVVAAVVVIGVLVVGVMLTISQVRESLPTLPTPVAPGARGAESFPPLDAAPSPNSGHPGQGGDEAAAQQLAVSLRSYLNNRNVDGLLQSVCEDGKVDDAARNELVEMPFLNPESPRYSAPINFPEGSVIPDRDGYLIVFFGSYTTTQESINLAFTAYVDGAGAFWCGVE
jgi:hypothetical protein